MSDTGFICPDCCTFIEGMTRELHIQKCAHDIRDFIDEAQRSVEQHGTPIVNGPWYEQYARYLFNLKPEIRSELWALVPLEVWPRIFSNLSIAEIHRLVENCPGPREAWNQWLETPTGREYRDRRFVTFAELHLFYAALLNEIKTLDLDRELVRAHLNATRKSSSPPPVPHYVLMRIYDVLGQSACTFLAMRVNSLLERRSVLRKLLLQLKERAKAENTDIGDLKEMLQSIIKHIPTAELEALTKRVDDEIRHEVLRHYREFRSAFSAIEFVWGIYRDLDLHSACASIAEHSSAVFNTNRRDYSIEYGLTPGIFYSQLETDHKQTSSIEGAIVSRTGAARPRLVFFPAAIEKILNTSMYEQVRCESYSDAPRILPPIVSDLHFENPV